MGTRANGGIALAHRGRGGIGEDSEGDRRRSNTLQRCTWIAYGAGDAAR